MQFQASQLKNLAKNNFKAKAIKLPMDWSQPAAAVLSKQYREGAPKQGVPPMGKLFQSASTQKLHCETVKKLHKQFEKYIDGMCTAAAGGVNQWMKLAMFSTGIINATACVIPPASLQGPPLLGMIQSKNPPMGTPMEMKYSNAIMNALNTAWMSWHMGLMGTIMYPPTFAAFPGPMHPPTPNIPIPVAALSSPGEAALSGAALKGAMIGMFGDPPSVHHIDLFDSIGSAFNTVFTSWKASTQVMTVQGTGPVPTFAPPYVPVGPVVGGCIIPAPGQLK